MRLLLVEDNADFAAELERALSYRCAVTWVRSRQSAITAVENDNFDLVILDRRIPSDDDVLDDHQDHGWVVFQHMLSRRPGTPVWFLTGAEDADFATDVNNNYAKREDLFGRMQPEQMYRVFWKKRITDCVREVHAVASKCAELERISVSGDADLSWPACRILRMFARLYDGVAIAVTPLSGGLSDSRVFKVDVRNASGGSIVIAVAKVASLGAIADEHTRYYNHIVRLSPGGFPQITRALNAGAGDIGGLFYGLVGDVQSLFERIAQCCADMEDVPRRLQRVEEPWYRAKQLDEMSVGDIRRHLISDTKLFQVRDQLRDIDLTEVEAKRVRVAKCSQHGDLHCANVLFASGGDPMLIDFGDAGPSLAALDPVTLELSTVFHSQHITLDCSWPTPDEMSRWVTVERYIGNCAYGSFIAACRGWAMDVAGSQEELVAIAYAYGLRQLKYYDTDKDLARALITACIDHLSRS